MKTKIILEVGYNHNGSFELAKKMINEAKKLKVWGIKFQKWEVEEFPNKIKNIKRQSHNSYGKNYYEHRKYLEFNMDQMIELKEYAEKKGLEFVCSGKDFTSLKKLIENGIRHIKLPSQRYKDNAIFKYLYKERGQKGFNILVSEGMCLGKEVYNSRWIDCADVLFHCISLYPAQLNETHFEFMRRLFFLRNYNNKACGYSSHEIDGKAIKYAVALGADYIERHFTLDKTDKGSDHKISSDPKEMRRIIKEIKEIEEILGDGTRPLSNKEWELREYYRSY
jgi:sialic acid synthase SpsE